MAEFKITGRKTGAGFVKEVVEQAAIKAKEIAERGNKKVLKQPKTFIAEPKVIKEKQGTLQSNVKQADDLDYKIKVSDDDAQKSLDEIFKLKSQGATKNVLDDFNIEKINDRGDFLLYIDQISKKYFKQFENTKGGVRSKKELLDLADILQQDQQKFVSNFLNLKPGSTLNDAQIFAAREILIAGHKKLDILAEAAVNGGPDALLAYKQHYATMAEYQRVLKGIQTETARALNQFKYKPRDTQFSNLSLDELNKIRLLEDLGGEEQTRNLAKLYLQNNARQKVEAVEATRGFLTATSESIGEVFLNVILSNPLSHIKNTVGNYLTQGITALERSIASDIGRISGSKGVAAYEDVAAAYGKQMAREAIWAAIGRQLNTKGSNTFQKIKNLKNVELENYLGGEKFDTNNIGKFTAKNFGAENNVVSQGIDIAGRILTLDRIPTKLLSVTDNYFKNIAFLEEMYAQAYRDTFRAIEQGILKADVESASTYMARLLNEPTEDMTKAAYQHALYVTYQTKLKDKTDAISKIGEGLISIKSKTPGLDFITNYYLPFIQTPTNIATFAIERMPVANLFLKNIRDDLAAGGARADTALAKMALGGLFYSTFGTMGYHGLIRGTNPGLERKGKSQTQDALNMLNKSARVDTQEGVNQISYAGLDPITFAITMAADLGQVARKIDLDNPQTLQEYLGILAEFTAAMGENLSDAAYFSGVGKFMEDYQKFSNYDFADFASKWSANYAASFIPAIVRPGASLNWTGDGYRKLATNLGEYVQKNLYDVNLPLDYDLFGDPIQKQIGVAGYNRQLKLDPIREEFLRVNPELTPVDRSYKKKVGLYNINVPYESDELSFIKKRAGELTKEQLQQLFQSDEYLRSDRQDTQAYQAEQIRTVINRSRTAAVAELFQDPDKQQSLINRISEQFDREAFEENRGKVLPDGFLLEQLNQ